MVKHQRVVVVGAGSWGTGLAILLARNGHRPLLWGRNQAAINQMVEQRENVRYLPGISFPDGLEATADLKVALRQADLFVVVIPSQDFRDVVRNVAAFLGDTVIPLIWATKGLEIKTGKLLHQVIEEEMGADVDKAILSGPSFAREVAMGLPTAVTIASDDRGFASYAAEVFHGQMFRTYTSTDVIGVELGGALKNVLAIAAGISDGLGFGANARAALITRGLSEIIRLGESFGAHRDTLTGLSGIGDIVLTCTDNQSRNRRLGLAIGEGEALPAALGGIGQAVEGAETAKVVERLALEKRVEMPIAEEVYRILYEGHDPQTAVSELLARDLKAEIV